LDLGGGGDDFGTGAAAALEAAAEVAGGAAAQAAVVGPEDNLPPPVDQSGNIIVPGSIFDSTSGDDNFTGGPNDDIFNAGAGADTFTGNGGRDIFKFTSASDSPVSGFDTITDFQPGLDLIILFEISGTNGTTFDFVGTTAFTNASSGPAKVVEARITDAGNLKIDIDDDGSADMKIVLTNDPTLSDGDFLFTPASS
jgi:Ca2+-binding RTX toxin-like protein